MHKALLRRWCYAMLKYQLHDTSCPLQTAMHGQPALPRWRGVSLPKY